MADHLKKIEATFEIVTPMFLGGAGHEAQRIRETSIKGALAFWWRALNFACHVAQADNDQDAALKTMKQRELELFGGPKGQGKFLLKVTAQQVQSVQEPMSSELQSLSYLGFGPVKPNGTATRSYLQPGGQFSLCFLFRQSTSSADIESVIRAVEIFGLFGGLGSRVRRGFGSISLLEWADSPIKSELETELCNAANTKQEYVNQFIRILGSKPAASHVTGGDLRVTCFAKETECRIVPGAKDDALGLLNTIGRELQLHRSWGIGGKVLGRAHERRFEGDHDWFKAGNNRDAAREFAGVAIENLPRRAAFGLPHNYYSRNGGDGDRGLSMTVEGPVKSTRDRRASPLFVHIQRLSDGTPLGCLLYFRNRFLEKPKLRISGRQKTYIHDPTVVSEFLNRRFFQGTSVSLYPQSTP